MATSHEPQPEHDSSRSPGPIRDLRVKPRGVLPRRIQMWLMVGIAIIILAIILFTGHPEPLARPQTGARPPQPALVPPDRVRSFQQQLAADLAREQQAIESPTAAASSTKRAGGAAAVDQTSDEQRRREYQSLFADNIALSRRPSDRQPYGEPRLPTVTTSPPAITSSPDTALLQQLLTAAASGRSTTPRSVPSSPFAPTTPSPTQPPAETTPQSSSTDMPLPKETGPIPAGSGPQRLLEGTIIETVLLNRLDGTFAGPVQCLVTTSVYSHDRQSVVIPAGARVLGAASPVQTWGDSRLAVSFHRLVMPDGRTYSLDRFKGLDQIGDTGLKDSVNHHYAQVFGASLAIGALSGLAQYSSRSTADSYTLADSYRQTAGSSLAASTGRILDRYLNVLPTITIREGYRIKVYLTNDLQLPTYGTVVPGGER